jgi:hypothetical protein
MNSESAVREVIARIETAWRSKEFNGLDECFHENAVIFGPGYAEYARGREKCAESYREFAVNASVLSYSESAHALHMWQNVAVYTFAWDMIYQRKQDSKHETGTDQLVFQLGPSRWELVFRYIHFAPSA